MLNVFFAIGVEIEKKRRAYEIRKKTLYVRNFVRLIFFPDRVTFKTQGPLDISTFGLATHGKAWIVL